MHKDDRISVHKNHSLCIRNVQQYDDTQYYCKIIPSNVSLKINLHVESSPAAKIFASDGRDISDRSITFRQGERIEIKCQGLGRPMPTIKWAANGQRIVDGGLHGVHIHDDGRLVIDHADHHHSLLYQCMAEYGTSVGHATININVQCKKCEMNIYSDLELIILILQIHQKCPHIDETLTQWKTDQLNYIVITNRHCL